MASPHSDLTRFTKTHEWLRPESELYCVGITAFAARELSDVVFVELPPAGSAIQQGKPFGVIESVKAAFDIYAPISGVVREVNDQLGSHPAWVNEDPLGRGYFCKIAPSNTAELSTLMTEQQYQAYIASQKHA